MSKLKINIFLILIVLILTSLACRVAVDYDGDGIVAGVPTESPSNKIEEIVVNKPTVSIEPTSTPNCPLNAEITNMYSIPEGFNILAGSDFMMLWEIQNVGCGEWPNGIYLQNISGDEVAQVLQVQIPSLKPNEKITIEVPMTTKDVNQSTYQSEWRLSTSTNKFFGPEFLSIIFIDNSSISKSSNDDAIVIDAKPVASEIEIISGPDMVIQNVELISTMEENGIVEFAVSIFNQGVEDMKEFKVQCVMVENNAKDEQLLSFVEKDQMARIYCTLPLPENIDQVSVTILVDFENSQLELDETNNIETYTFTMTMTP